MICGVLLDVALAAEESIQEAEECAP